MKPPRLGHIDLSVEDAFQVLDEPHMVECSCIRVEIDQEVDVALARRFRACDRTEDARIPRLVGAHRDQQLLALRPDDLGRPKTMPLANGP